MPDDPNEVRAWIASAIDEDSPRRPRRGWKNAVLGGASVHQLMSAMPNDVTYHFRVTATEAIVIARVVVRSGLNRNAFVRRALAHWLVSREGVDPTQIPKLAKDL